MSIDARNPLNRVGERVVFHHLLNDFVSSWHTLYVPADKKHTPSRVLENMVFTLSSITDSAVLSQDSSVTYSYYQNNIKKAPVAADKKKGFVCTVCGYIYEGLF